MMDLRHAKLFWSSKLAESPELVGVVWVDRDGGWVVHARDQEKPWAEMAQVAAHMHEHVSGEMSVLVGNSLRAYVEKCCDTTCLFFVERGYGKCKSTQRNIHNLLRKWESVK